MSRGALALLALAMFQTPEAGPAFLSGAVRDAVTGGPVRGAAVRLLPAGRLRPARIVYTNNDGRFTFDRLPVGAYAVNARHDRYFEAQLGMPDFALEYGMEQVPLYLNAGQSVIAAVMTMLPTSSIAGRVTDEHDRPKPKAIVFLRQRTVVGGIDWLSSPRERSVHTDEDGAYRFEDLRPGSYFVGISWGGAGFPDTSHAYQPIFYPNATRAEQATPIELEPGDVRETADLHLTLVPTRAIFGRVSSGNGGVHGAYLRLMRPIARERPSLEPLELAGTATTIDGGGFMLKNVVPGSYTLVAFWTDPRVSGMRLAGTAASHTPIDANGSWARLPIEVRDTDLVDIEVPLQPRLELHGQLSLEGAGTAPAFEPPQIALLPVTGGYASGPSVRLRGERNSLLANGLVPGLYRVQLMFAPEWRVKSVRFGDREVSTTPFEITGQSAAELRVTVTHQTSGVFGSIINPQGSGLRDPVAVIYTTNRNDWASGIESHLVQTVPARNGRFVVDRLDPGDYYVAAVDRAKFLTGDGAAGFPALAGTSFLVYDEGHTRGSTYDAVTPTLATLEQWSAIAAKVTVAPGTRVAVAVPLIPAPSSSKLQNPVSRELLPRAPPHVRVRPRGASIEGMVRDPAGDPAMGIEVLALRSNLTGAGGFNRVRSGRTDRYGRYAIDGLSQGEYVVAIPGRLAGGEIRVEGTGQTVSRAEVFYPGVAEFGKARPIAVGENEVRDRVDLALTWTQASVISGGLSWSGGTALAQALVQVRATQGRLFSSDFEDHYLDDSQVDRDYRFAGLLAGRYIIEARASEAQLGDMAGENGRVCWGRLEVDVDGQHPVIAPIALQPGAIVAVLFRFEGERPGENWQWDVAWKPEGRLTTALPNIQVPKLTVGDAISWNGLPAGTFRLNPSVRGWRVTSITRADKPFDGLVTVSLGDEVRDIVVTLAKSSR